MNMRVILTEINKNVVEDLYRKRYSNNFFFKIIILQEDCEH